MRIETQIHFFLTSNSSGLQSAQDKKFLLELEFERIKILKIKEGTKKFCDMGLFR